MHQEIVKFRAGRYMLPVTLIYKDSRIYVKFNYNKILIKEVKSMQGAKWHGFDKVPRKIWSISNSPRNKFQIQYLIGKNPYSWYDQDLVDLDLKERCDQELYQVQKDMSNFFATYRKCIAACEMGVGKTLSVFLVAEKVWKEGNWNQDDIWYIGPKSGVRAVTLELEKWNIGFMPRMFTYQGLVKEMTFWPEDKMAPRFVIFDESSKIKNPNSQRSQAAMHLANAVREEHGDKGYIILMSGTPAPKNPVDWWHQAEIACPGFLKEGQQNKFKMRLCLIEERQSITGGVYPHIVTWLDDKNKCAICGQLKEHENHQTGDSVFDQVTGLDVEGKHRFQKSINEVSNLYLRLKGLVLVRFKKDCLDLPEKRYEEIKVTPTVEILRAAKIIVAKSTRGAQACMLLRELSDGFQYQEVKTGTETCPNCLGTGKCIIKVSVEGINPLVFVPNPDYRDKEAICDNCGGSGQVNKYERQTNFLKCPKDEYFIQELDDHEETGRFVVWGGFTATVDRLIQICHKYRWATLRVDGRGYFGTNYDGTILDDNDLLKAMDKSHKNYKEYLELYPKLCFVGQPEAGGMALTLTATPTELFFSNSFKGDARMQAEDRCHRLGMDKNRGLTIKDLLMLPSDKLVLDNLKQKKDLQAMSMGALQEAFNE